MYLDYCPQYISFVLVLTLTLKSEEVDETESEANHNTTQNRGYGTVQLKNCHFAETFRPKFAPKIQSCCLPANSRTPTMAKSQNLFTILTAPQTQ